MDETQWRSFEQLDMSFNCTFECIAIAMIRSEEDEIEFEHEGRTWRVEAVMEPDTDRPKLMLWIPHVSGPTVAVRCDHVHAPHAARLVVYRVLSALPWTTEVQKMRRELQEIFEEAINRYGEGADPDA